MARKTKAEAERTRLKILKSALSLFVEKGFERTTFEDIAAKIKLTKGAVYWHFKSKQDLLGELVVHMAADAESPGKSWGDPESFDELERQFVERAKRIITSPPHRKFFYLMTRLDWSATRFEAVKRRLLQLESSIFSVIERTLLALQKQGTVRADVDVASVTAILGSMWVGLIKTSIDHCLEQDLLKTVGLGFGLVIDSIRADVRKGR